jgi:hypothetical protein
VNRLLKLFEKHCVSVHSFNEGNVESITASGRFTAGLHGLLAQLEREKIVENVTTSMHELIKAGYWLNTPPIGYDLVDNILIANDDAHLVRRAFVARAGGASYPDVARVTGLKYSTARHLLANRVYLGFVRIKDQWFPGRHDSLITHAEFEAASRGHIPADGAGPISLRAESGAACAASSLPSTPTDAGNPSTGVDTAARAAAFRVDRLLVSIALLDWASTSCGPMTS